MNAVCEVCGAPDPVVIVPGAEGSTALFDAKRPLAVDTFTIRRPVADRVFCSIEHARQCGWPWLKSQTAAPRARRCA